MANTKKNQGPRVTRDRSTGAFFLVVDGASYPVDNVSLERTIGVARFAGEGLVDEWADAAWAGLLAHLGLPATTAMRADAATVVRRLVQKLWLAAFEPAEPAAAARMAAKDEAARAKYAAAFGTLTEPLPAFAARAAHRAPTAVAYAPTPALKDVKGLKGQARALLSFFKRRRFAPATTAEAADGMVACGLKTTTAPARIAAFYLCDWAKRGWLERRPCFA